MNMTMDSEVREYLQAVESELADLGEEERGGLLEDLGLHLREVAAEGEGTLQDRLGPPASYAAELRASAGLPAREPAEAMGLRRPRAATRAFRKVADAPPVRWARGAIQGLTRRPWVRRVLVLGVVVVVAMAAYEGGRSSGYGRAFGQFRVIPPEISHTSQSQICPYGADGTPLENVLLFDRLGRPIPVQESRSASGASGQSNSYPRPPVTSMSGEVTTRACQKLASLEISASEAAWVSVDAIATPHTGSPYATESRIFTSTLQPGETKTFHGPRLSVVIGNAGGVRLKVNGVDAGTLGTSGQVFRAVYSATSTAAMGDTPPDGSSGIRAPRPAPMQPDPVGPPQ
ncbi:MAG TPA: RodZ domain-containing protein [Actinomycetota bacterium]|nr:RodZ domain-containing protein [Actinomycetota bacterium]